MAAQTHNSRGRFAILPDESRRIPMSPARRKIRRPARICRTSAPDIFGDNAAAQCFNI
ncbi:hypothetical protein [Neisseria lactamica]|uniref:hypothetical protein n=1 Tax=Neisseria lactamica TaxID=486 RepID=UPI0015F10B11|nr:hypothetical protein [Neisseria lactamica]